MTPAQLALLVEIDNRVNADPDAPKVKNGWEA